MKQRHLLSLLQSGFTTIQVYFPEDHRSMAPAIPPAPKAQSAPTHPRDSARAMPWQEAHAPWQEAHTFRAVPETSLYTYKVRGAIAVGDLVIVESTKSPSGIAIAVVHSVDPTARIDVDADFDYKWIIQRVDRTAYDKALAEERAFQDTLQEVERQKQRDELLHSMNAHIPVGTAARAMFDAAIATYAPQAVIGTAPVQTAAPEPAPAPADAGPYAGFAGVACK